MQIAITVDPNIPVPPPLYGGIERVVDFLVRGLVARGHRVTLFAHPASDTCAGLVPYGAPPHSGYGRRIKELWQVGTGLLLRQSQFDLIHSFGRLAALVPVLLIRGLPKVQTYQRDAVPWASIEKAVLLAGDSICFTACSASVCRSRPRQDRFGGRWHVIFNGVDLAKYEFRPRVPSDAPLVFLGRLERIKGVHNAIAIARATGRKLLIAGNKVQTGPDADYFESEIAPFLGGRQICYLGPVDDRQKNSLLGSAASLLMPIEWEEPFGIVMVEAMACGTPVIGFPRGSLPEVVRHGVNGYLCPSLEKFAEAVGALDRIDRAVVRADCEARFGDRAIVNAYEQLYEQMIRHRP